MLAVIGKIGQRTSEHRNQLSTVHRLQEAEGRLPIIGGWPRTRNANGSLGARAKATWSRS